MKLLSCSLESIKCINELLLKRLIPYSYRNVYTLIINTITSIIDVSFSGRFDIGIVGAYCGYSVDLYKASECADFPACEQLHFRYRFQLGIQLHRVPPESGEVHACAGGSPSLPPVDAGLECDSGLFAAEQLG